MTDDAIVPLMKEVGFTATEAKAYLALLEQSPATGYDVATRSDVPRSAVYSVLRRLEAGGFVNAVQDKPARYIPLPPGRLHRLLSSRFSKNVDHLRTELEKVAGSADEGLIWTVHGHRAVIEQAEALVRRSRQSVHASLWAREATALSEALVASKDRGVSLVLFSFNPLPEVLAEGALSYGIGEAELERFWSHRIIVVSDGDRALLGGAELDESCRAVLTDEPALVEMAVSNLILDITLLGQRTGADTSGVVTKLTERFAPIEKLAGGLVKGR